MAMNHPLLATLNLVAMMLLFALLAGAIAHAHWRRAGGAAVIIWLIGAGQIWLLPQALSFYLFESTELLYVLWFGNWLVSGVAIILFTLTFRDRSPHLLEAARMDGAGAFSTYRLVIWPYAKPALGALLLLLFMATSIEFFRPLFPDSGNSILPVGYPAWSLPTAPNELLLLLAGSVAATLPLIAIYFGRRCFFTHSDS